VGVVETLTEAYVLVGIGVAFLIAAALMWVGDKINAVRSR
jgi:hypothetical protein